MSIRHGQDEIDEDGEENVDIEGTNIPLETLSTSATSPSDRGELRAPENDLESSSAE